MGIFDKLIGKKKEKTATELARESYTNEQREHEKTIGEEAYWAARIGGTKARKMKEGYAAGFSGKKKGSGFLGVMEDLGTAFNNLENSPIGQSFTEPLEIGGGFGVTGFSESRGNRQSRQPRRNRRKKHHNRGSKRHDQPKKKSSGMGYNEFLGW
jgi:hypothetical protein